MAELAPRIVAVSLLLVANLGAARAESLADRARAIDRPAVVGALAVAPIRIGRGTITPRAGARLWRLAAGDRPCGVWLEGGADFTYTIDDPIVLPVARKNLKSASSLRFDDAAERLTVREALRGAVIWGWEAAADFERGAEGGALPPFPAWAHEILEQRRFAPPSPSLLEAGGNAVRGVLYAVLDGEKESLLVTADPRSAVAAEQLTVLWKLPQLYRDFAGRLVPIRLAEQPIGRAFHAPRAAEIVARRYEIAVTQTGERAVRIRSRIDLQAVRAGVAVWAAELDHETVDDGTVYPVRLVTASVDGQPATVQFADGVLVVDLGRALPSGGTASVEVVTEGEYAARPNQDSFWWLGFEAWHPRPLEMRDVLAEYEIAVDVAGPWVPYASGKTVERSSENGRNRLKSRLAGPMRMPVVTVGRYSELSEVVDGVRVNVASYAFEKPDEAARLVRNFGVLRQCLEKLFGVPYPFEELDILEVNAWGFGFAPAGVVLVTREAFTKAGMVRATGESSVGVNELLAHEVAHAYWGHVVKYDTAAEQWLSESFADYTGALCLSMAAEDERQGRRLFDKIVNEWRGRASLIRSGVAVATANDQAFKDDIDAHDRISTLYARGPLVLHAIREELGRQRGSEEQGDKYFAAFLRAIVKNFAHRAATTEDLIGILEQISGQPWRPFFVRYVYGTETPKRR